MDSSVPPYMSKFELDAAILLGAGLLLLFLRLLDGLVLGDRLNKNFAVQARGPFRPATFFVASFLHSDRQHLFGNLPFFLSLGFLTMLPNTRDFIAVTIVTIVVKGTGTWLFGRPGSNHLGASGLIFGYFGFLLTRGFFIQDTGQVLCSLTVLILYQVLIPQIYPRQEGISKTGHFFGFVGGIVAAWLLGRISFGV